MAKIVLGIPTYLYQAHSGLLGRIVCMSAGNHQIAYFSIDSSAQMVTMNATLIHALEQYESGNADYLLFWHSDIVPEPMFVDKLMAIAEAKDAEVLSVIVPIKDEKGLTSTALDEPMGDEPPEWRVRRLTMSEVMGVELVNGQKLEPTFTLPNLLVNTGLLLIKLSAPWVQEIYFHFEDKIIKHNGRRRAVLVPEDWMFSRDARKLGCNSIWATREVYVEHKGMSTFPNNQVWGWKRDHIPKSMAADVIAACEAANKVSGYMAYDELAYLATAAKEAKCIVELGSWKGRSTKAMAMVTKGKIYAVDSWRGTPNGDATGVEADARGRDTIKGEFFDNVATPHREVVIPTDCEHAFAGTALKAIAGEVDFQFIDGDHSYESVKRDILTCLDLAAPGGIISGHDINEPGVQQAVRELLPDAKIAIGTIWEHRVPATAAVVA